MNWWTRALKSLISADERDRIDLFRMFPSIRRFLAARHHYAYMRIGSDLLFVFVLLLGLFGPRDPTSNIAVFFKLGSNLAGYRLKLVFCRSNCGA